MEDGKSRKLAVILHADVVGSTRLVQQDETLAHERIQNVFHRFSKTIQRYGGTAHELRGDALVAEFERASDAVEASLAFQDENTQFNSTLKGAVQPVLRIGISLGEVVVADNTITGEGIVLAQRLEQLASGGGVCVQGAVYEAVPGRLPFGYESLGEQKLKGISEPVRAYLVTLKPGEALPAPEVRAVPGEALPERRKRARILVAAVVLLAAVGGGLAFLQPWVPEEQATSVERTALPTPDKPSLAVLPFDNFSGDPALNYFADGFSEDIITTLSRFPDLAVISRNSSFVYKGKATDIRQIGKELGAAYVLEGSVRKQADKIRLTAQLIDAASGEHVWAERYDEEGTDPWALQDDVITKIVSSLTGEEGQLKQAEYKRTWGKDSGSLEEYDYYLRGHELFIKAETEDVHEQAGAIWAEGLRKFPNSSLLRVKLALYHLGLVWGYWSDDPDDSIQEAERLVQEAMSLPALSPQARRLGHWAMAWAQQMKGDLPQALAEAKAAIALAPYDAYMVSDLAAFPAMASEPAKSIALLEEMQSRNRNFEDYWDLSLAYYLAGDYERAVQAALEIRLGSLDRYVLLASGYVRLGQMDEARAAIEKLLELNPQFTQDDLKEGYQYSDLSILERQAADLGKAGLPEK